jgi:dTDP-4-amino-4,6-dideoxygalactose transaminase
MIVLAGATPVFADIDPATFNLDPGQVAARITPRTKAVLPVHLFGQLADVTALRAIAEGHGLPLIGDGAQAIGAEHRGLPVARWSLLTTLSFFPTKNLGAAGDGGMVLTDDDALAERLRTLRFHGSRGTYNYQVVGVCSRLDAIQAAVLGVKLPHLPAWNEARRCHAALYDVAFASLPEVPPPAASRGTATPTTSTHCGCRAGSATRCGRFWPRGAWRPGYTIPARCTWRRPTRASAGGPAISRRPERACREVLSLPVVPS